MSKTVSAEGTNVVRMSQAGEELVKRMVVLYNSQIFVREGKDLREQLLLSGIEAGSRLASVSTLAERAAKVAASNEAVLALNRAVYIANAMFMLGLYEKKQVAPVLNYCTALLNALKDLLSRVPEKRRVIRVKNPVNVVNSVASAFNVPEEDEYVPEIVFESSGFENSDGSSDGFDDLV